MNQIACETCGSAELLKVGDCFVCQICGSKYSVEEASKMMIEGRVDVCGTVKIDSSEDIEKYITNARRAYDKEDWEELEKFYSLVEQNTTNNIEASFFSSYGRAMLSLYDSEYFKREQKFLVLKKSISVISNYYNLTNENTEEVLLRIAYAIKKMSSTTFTYNPHNFVTHGSFNWQNQLFQGIVEAFKYELKLILNSNNAIFIEELINIIDPSVAARKAQAAAVQEEKERRAKQQKENDQKDKELLQKSRKINKPLILAFWISFSSIYIISFICAMMFDVATAIFLHGLAFIIISLLSFICAIVALLCSRYKTSMKIAKTISIISSFSTIPLPLLFVIAMLQDPSNTVGVSFTVSLIGCQLINIVTAVIMFMLKPLKEG